MTERKARRLASAGAMVIASLILVCAMVNFIKPENDMCRKVFVCLLGLLFLYARAIPGKLWVPD